MAEEEAAEEGLEEEGGAEEGDEEAGTTGCANRPNNVPSRALVAQSEVASCKTSDSSVAAWPDTQLRRVPSSNFFAAASLAAADVALAALTSVSLATLARLGDPAVSAAASRAAFAASVMLPGVFAAGAALSASLEV